MDSVSKQIKHLPLHGRPRMLKDFLLDDLNSCSSSGFKWLPRRAPDDQTIPNLNSGNSRLQRSRSKAATTTMSAFRAVINAAKNIHFAAVKSPSILPRSLSRRLSRKNSGDRNADNKENEVEKIRVITIKDIMRWKSFHDLVDEKCRPVDFASSPQHCTTATVTTTTTGSTNTPCSSSGSSWCESDFTSEYLPGEECGEKYLPCVGKDLLMEATTATASEPAVGPKGELNYEDEEQQSPVSVLSFQYEEDEEPISSFNQSLANMERTKQNVMQKIQRFECLAKMDPTNLEEWMSMEETSGSEADQEEYDYEMDEVDEVEEKAKQLLNHVKATRSLGTNKNSFAKLLLDLFREELAKNNKYGLHNKDDEEIVRVAKAWMDGEHGGTVEWGAEDKREIFVRDMDGGPRWSKFEEEEENVAFEVECGLMNHLLDELLGDLFSYCFFTNSNRHDSCLIQ